MQNEIHLKVKKQLEDIDTLLKDAIKKDILPEQNLYADRHKAWPH